MQVSFLNTYICCCQSWDQFHCSSILTHLTAKFHFPICLSPPSLWETLNWWMMLVLATSVFCFFVLCCVGTGNAHSGEHLLIQFDRSKEMVSDCAWNAGLQIWRMSVHPVWRAWRTLFLCVCKFWYQEPLSVCWLSCCGELKLCSHSVTLCLPSQILQ
jgi:hypothetical protein